MARRIKAKLVVKLLAAGLSQNAIAKSQHVSKRSVEEVARAARDVGLDWVRTARSSGHRSVLCRYGVPGTASAPLRTRPAGAAPKGRTLIASQLQHSARAVALEDRGDLIADSIVFVNLRVAGLSRRNFRTCARRYLALREYVWVGSLTSHR